MKKRCNQILTFVLAFFMPMMSYAHDVEVDEIFYKGDSSENEDYTRSFRIPSSIIYNGTRYSVTAIGDGAFRNCFRLRSVTLPNTITSIGENAFAKCNGLTSFVVPGSVTSIGKKAPCLMPLPA